MDGWTRTPVPEEILAGFDQRLRRIADAMRIRSYRHESGDPEGAQGAGFDDSDWVESADPVGFRRDQGVTWFRCAFAVPARILDIPLEGTSIRLSTLFLAPTDVYVDGELKLSERTWMDFKSPEVMLTHHAVAGRVHRVAVRLDLRDSCYFDGSFQLECLADSVEDAAFELRSFRAELAYACRFEEVREILPEVFRRLASCLQEKSGVLELVETIRCCRELLRPMEGSAKRRTVHLIGHAHIDLHWFWSEQETRDVVRRDFDTMTRLMEEIPGFRFSQSQCALYEMAETEFPDLFERMRRCIASGRWDVTASTWVEGDMNLASGEALARHFLISRSYLEDRFGSDVQVMWNPDAFGHSANLPQIMKKSGIAFYFFMRCGKDAQQPNEGRYGSLGQPVFWWEGLDGTRILACNTIYSTDVRTDGIVDIASRLEDRYGLLDSMFVYGTGDHGGGPTRRDIRRALQLQAFPTLPTIAFGTTAAFFRRIADQDRGGIPVERGEMNPVFDGCYTTHADIKRDNRICENLLVDTETMASVAALHGGEYPSVRIGECWKRTLHNQFHDILDGSGIPSTYAFSSREAKRTIDDLHRISSASMERLGTRIRTSGGGIPTLLFNATGWIRSETVKIPDTLTGEACYGARDAEGRPLLAQRSVDGLWVHVNDIPAMGYGTLHLLREGAEAEHDRVVETDDAYRIETKFHLLEIEKSSGEISTLFDKTCGRYVVRRGEPGWRNAKGVLNSLRIDYEAPAPMSAWTIGPISRSVRLISGAESAILEDGVLVKRLRFVHRVDVCTLSQDIVIRTQDPRIDFITHVDWRGTGGPKQESPMLKVCFTPDVVSDRVACEIPFGALDRPCQDVEVPALSWIDLSDAESGLSLLNDCKYGHRVKGNGMELTLVRSGWEPDPASDAGPHDFTYSILPHAGRWDVAGSYKAGWFLNHPLACARMRPDSDADLDETYSLATLDKENVVVSAFKRAESGDAFLLRVFEGSGRPTDATATLGFPVARMEEVDLCERPVEGPSTCDGRTLAFRIGRHEIRTFKLHPC